MLPDARAMTTPLATLTDVTRRFTPGAPPAVDRVSARIEAGRVTGLIGPDAAGKTTLMRLMTALLLPDEGSITLLGRPVRAETTDLLDGVGYMPQRFGLYEDLTVAENLTLYADLQGVTGTARAQAFTRLLAFTRLAPFTARLAGRLSGGMKQKLGLACALISRPRLLLLDEPGVGVDPLSRRELWAMVHALAGEGVGVVWSTAYLDEAAQCATVLLLNEGRVVHDGPPQRLTERVRGRTALLRGAADRRAVLARAVRHPAVVDALIQGEAVRLVGRGSGPLPSPRDLGAAEATLHPAEPRFEDAFMDLLGGVPGDLAGMPPPLDKRPTGRAPSGGLMVEADRLTRRFGTFTAADGVSFAIRAGEIFGLLGPNGAGKSTLFKMVCGLLKPTSGAARVAGLDLAAAPGAARARLGYMAQKFSLYGDLSVRQNLAFFGRTYGLSRGRLAEATGRLVETFGLGPLLDRDAGSLPLGQKQRLALAVAILHDPPVLFLDEPTSGVDPVTRRAFWLHINALVAAGTTVLVTTHFMEEAEYCDRTALIYQGVVIAEGTPDGLKRAAASLDKPEPTLEEAFIALVEAQDRRPGGGDQRPGGEG